MTDLEKYLRSIYQHKGMQFTYEVCSKLLCVKDATGKKRIVNGNVCEILLCLMTEDYIAKKNIEGFIAHSLILKDPKNPSSKFRTEIDFLFCTKSVIFCTECKSFVGHKKITNKFTLHTKNKEFDVFGQNKLHVDTLYKNIKMIKLKTTNKLNIAMSVFLFSNGDIEDTRTLEYRSIMPAITQNTLYQFYNSILSGTQKETIWDIVKLKSFISTVLSNKQLREEHRQYLGY